MALQELCLDGFNNEKEKWIGGKGKGIFGSPLQSGNLKPQIRRMIGKSNILKRNASSKSYFSNQQHFLDTWLAHTSYSSTKNTHTHT